MASRFFRFRKNPASYPSPGLSNNGIDGNEGKTGTNGTSIHFIGYDITDWNTNESVIQNIKSNINLSSLESYNTECEYTDGDIIISNSRHIYRIHINSENTEIEYIGKLRRSSDDYASMVEYATVLTPDNANFKKSTYQPSVRGTGYISDMLYNIYSSLTESEKETEKNPFIEYYTNACIAIKVSRELYTEVYNENVSIGMVILLKQKISDTADSVCINGNPFSEELHEKTTPCIKLEIRQPWLNLFFDTSVLTEMTAIEINDMFGDMVRKYGNEFSVSTVKDGTDNYYYISDTQTQGNQVYGPITDDSLNDVAYLRSNSMHDGNYPDIQGITSDIFLHNIESDELQYRTIRSGDESYFSSFTDIDEFSKAIKDFIFSKNNEYFVYVTDNETGETSYIKTNMI